MRSTRLGTLVVVLLLLTVSHGAAQTPNPYPYTQPPTTHPEVYRAVSVTAYSELGRTLLGPNFGRGRAFTTTRTFRLSMATKKDVDGMVKTVTEKITAPASSSPAELEKAWRAALPSLIAKLAAKVSPYTAIGSFLDTAAKNTDATTLTPDRLVFQSFHPLTIRTRYTRGLFTGAHDFHVDVLVGN